MTGNLRPLYGHPFIGNNHADRRKVYVPMPLTIPPPRPSLSERAHTAWRVTVGAYRFVERQLSPQGWRAFGRATALCFILGIALLSGKAFGDYGSADAVTREAAASVGAL